VDTTRYPDYEWVENHVAKEIAKCPGAITHGSLRDVVAKQGDKITDMEIEMASVSTKIDSMKEIQGEIHKDIKDSKAASSRILMGVGITAVTTLMGWVFALLTIFVFKPLAQ